VPLLASLAVVAVAVAPFLGGTVVEPRAVVAGDWGPGTEIFWKIRVPRVLTAFLAGAGLAGSGMALQALFRNPLATPFTLGISSGAAFGAAVYLLLAAATPSLWHVGQAVCALGGALLAAMLVFGLSRARRSFSTATMLLAGVAVSFFFSALILALQYLADFTKAFRMMGWLMGSVDVVGFRPVGELFPFVAVGAVVLLALSRELNLLLTGEELAQSRGMNVAAVKKTIFFVTSLMVGGVVAQCGPIAFVGLIVPHICRILVGPDHFRLGPCTLLLGGAFLCGCDTVARTVIAPVEMPVGILTALLGAPFFLWLLFCKDPEQLGL
jgi:iron complex transport system permease protein